MGVIVEVREYTLSDGSVCHGLRRNAFLGEFQASLSLDAARLGADSYDVIEFARRISAMNTLVATKEGVVVGFCTIHVVARHRAEILYLYVDSESRGAGVGSLLVCQAEQQVIDTHPEISVFFLDTAVPDYNQKFWEKLGYRYVCTSTCQYPNGQIEAVRLEKIINRGEV